VWMTRWNLWQPAVYSSPGYILKRGKSRMRTLKMAASPSRGTRWLRRVNVCPVNIKIPAPHSARGSSSTPTTTASARVSLAMASGKHRPRDITFPFGKIKCAHTQTHGFTTSGFGCNDIFTKHDMLSAEIMKHLLWSASVCFYNLDAQGFPYTKHTRNHRSIKYQ
jgi:hypothetical protein